MDEDQKAIDRVLEGDLEAFAELVRRHQRAVFRLVRNLLPHGADHEDVAQEAFMAALSSLQSYQPARGRFSSWLLTITRNRCLNAIKRKRPVLLEQLPQPAGDDPGAAERSMAQAQLFARLDRALQDLPESQRVAFVLAEIQQLTLEETAQIEGVGVGTIKSRVSRAKQKLRALLEARETRQEFGTGTRAGHRG